MTTALLAKLIGLQVRIPADQGHAIIGQATDAKVSYGKVRVHVIAPHVAGGDRGAWVDADRCYFGTPNGIVPGHKILSQGVA